MRKFMHILGFELNPFGNRMYARKKKLKMKAIFGVFFFLTFYLQAQPPQNTNNAVLNNGNINVEMKSEVHLDSIQLQGFQKTSNATSDDNDAAPTLLEKEVETYKAIRLQTKSNAFARSPSEEAQQSLDNNAKAIQAIAPETIESNLLYYDAGNYNADRAGYLQKSLEKEPQNEEALTLWIANSLVIGDTIQTFESLMKMDKLGFIPKDVLCYAQDLYTSVPENTILITHGKWDTYGFVYAQLKAKTKPNVLNVSLDLLQSPQYRELLKNKGLRIPSGKIIDVSYLKALCELNQTKQFAFSMTIPKAYLVQFKDQMSPNGLVFLYPSNDQFSKVAANNEDYFDRFLFMECGQTAGQALVGLNGNYFPMLMVLEQQYADEKGSNSKLAQVIKRKEKIKKKLNKSPK